MILDYNYSKKKRNFSISYITETGGKKVLNFNVDKFKTFYSTPNGKYENWDGSRCDIKYTENPSKFDIKTFIEEMSPKYKQLLNGYTAPKVYTFDIETKLNELLPEEKQKYKENKSENDVVEFIVNSVKK